MLGTSADRPPAPGRVTWFPYSFRINYLIHNRTQPILNATPGYPVPGCSWCPKIADVSS